MKIRFLIYIMAFFIATISYSQEMYVMCHYVKVKNENAAELESLEKNVFSKLHQKNITDGKKIGWDLWIVENDGDPDHVTYNYAHLISSIDDLWAAWPEGVLSENEIQLAQKRWNEIVVDGYMLMTKFLGGFVPAANEKPVQYAAVNFMKVNPLYLYEYEQDELTVWQSFHKQNKNKKGWGLHKFLTPRNENESNYFTVQFYEDLGALFKDSEITSKLSKTQKQSYGDILKMRSIDRIDIQRLILAIR